MADIEYDVDAKGPVFDGRDVKAVQDFMIAVENEIGAQALANVQMFLDRSIKNPTPYYETQVMVQRVADSVVVHDRGIIYGPWLEDGGSRSAIFPGYHSFRRAKEQTTREMSRLIQAVMARFIGRM